ncbi:MAG: PA0069 family radical SAM protein [Bacteroidota bacterium]
MNPFLKTQFVTDHIEGVDEPGITNSLPTEIFYETPSKIVNKVTSPDVGMDYSLNPYQGCEHGCIYCYARTTHEYWGFNAGLDFESKIIVKKNAAVLLEKQLLKKSWQPRPIVLSGNTDCYQPLERKLGITRSLLEIFDKYKHPVAIITKNTLVLRDLDILAQLAKDNLVMVILSITTLDEKLRSLLEPRTASGIKKMKAIAELTQAGVPVSIMNAPIIPGLNHHETPSIIKKAAQNGALSAGYTTVRLNGKIATVFHDWLVKNFPHREKKVWNQIKALHGGKVSDSEFGRRMRGEGSYSEIIKQLFTQAVNRYMSDSVKPVLTTSKFRKGGNYGLF